MRSYEAARGLYSFLGICSWAVIVIGGIIAFGGSTAVGSLGRNPTGMQMLLAAAPGLVMALSGLFGLALVQMGRSGVDSAEYAQQSLQVSREQLEVSRQVLEQGRKTAASYAALVERGAAAPKPAASPEDNTTPSYNTRPDEPTTAADVAVETETPRSLEHTPEIPLSSNPKAKAPARNIAAITEDGGKYHVGERTFATNEEAERYASQLGVNQNAKLSDA